MRGRREKKGAKGTQAYFITRTSAIKKLQITLKDFRRLCILKGIYPREPKQKFKGTNKTYYYMKDIMFLMHEPVLQTLRAQKAQLKKIKKASTTKNRAALKRLKTNMPRYTLDHLVRERYPTFVDALRDMSDPLCMLFLFAMLKTSSHFHPDRAANCLRLTKEWMAYVAESNTLRKVFFSIKGIYYQASIQGQAVTWIVPYSFTTEMPDNVDRRVMLTFLEFYETLAGFVLFKLFTDLGFKYPPRVSSQDLVVRGKLLGSNNNGDDNNNNNNGNNDNGNENADGGYGADEKKTFQLQKERQLLLEQQQNNGRSPHKLFESLVFYINRETPQTALTFIIHSCRGKVVFKDSDSTITHHVIDRPLPAAQQRTNRVYIQPQWVADCVNNAFLLPASEYAPGSALPPHLSPFVVDAEEGYFPERAKEIKDIMARAKANHPKVQDYMDDGGGDENEDEDEDEDDEDEEDEEEDEEEEEDERGPKEKSAAAADDDGNEDEDEDEDEAAKKELNVKRALTVMGKKQKRLYARMQFGIEKKRKKQKAEKLQDRAQLAKKQKKN